MESPDTDHRLTPPPRRRPPPTGSGIEPDDDAIDTLLSAAGQGDVRALGALYDQTAPTVLGLLRGVLGDRAPAEEATERVYLHLWREAPRFDPRTGSARSLLLRTARRELIHHTCTHISAHHNADGAHTSPPARW